jgi:hypothetical protein
MMGRLLIVAASGILFFAHAPSARLAVSNNKNNNVFIAYSLFV